MTAKIFAHRGSSAAYPEHTRAAYLQALADGADGVECDLQLSADGALILLHDEDISRTSNSTGPVAEMTLAQLRALDFSSWHGSEIPVDYGTMDQQLLTLPDLLDLLTQADRPVELAVEFKYGADFDPALIETALTVLRDRKWVPETSQLGDIKVSFMAFDPDAVTYLAQRVPVEHLCQLVEIVGADDFPAQQLRKQLVDDGVAHLAGPGVEYLRTNPGDGARWLAAGRTLRVWTVDSAADLEFCLAAGVTQLTTNTPQRLRSMLAARS